jgi:hypothetical protein
MSRPCANWVLQALAQTSPPQHRAQQRGEEIELLSVSNYSCTERKETDGARSFPTTTHSEVISAACKILLRNACREWFPQLGQKLSILQIFSNQELTKDLEVSNLQLLRNTSLKSFGLELAFLQLGGATRTKEWSPRALRLLAWWLWMLSSRTMILPSAVSIMFSHRECRAVLAASSSISSIAIPAVAKGLHPCWTVTHLHQVWCCCLLLGSLDHKT